MPFALLCSCWFTDAELAAALAAGADSSVDQHGDGSNSDSGFDTDSGADSDSASDTSEQSYTCVEGDSLPSADAPTDYTGPASVRMVGIPDGSFCMGSEFGNVDEQPVHPVTLTRAFWVAETEVTQDQYEALVGSMPSANVGCGDCPVEQVTWYEAATFANAASDAEGLEPCYTSATEPEPAGDPYACGGYRLPTEAEWEFAARGGESYTYSGSEVVDDVAWHEGNSGGETQPVRTRDPNAWGLHDMSGNVWEWTGDWYEGRYYDDSPSADPGGASEGSWRVFRGGAYDAPAIDIRVSYRYGHGPSESWVHLGFRLARTSP